MVNNGISRRRAVTILAACAGALTIGQRGSIGVSADHEWRGYAFGTDARIIFSGADADTVRSLSAGINDEIERLEKALSLFRHDSDIVRLNRDKMLAAPTGDMSRALQLALDVARATNGLFDPTVQALWTTYVDWFAENSGAGLPPGARIEAALQAVDWRRIEVSNDRITLGGNQAVTLNGLGQGYATDRIADLLRAHGVTHVLIDLGEQRALGAQSNGSPWLVARNGGLSDLELTEGALATSEGSGCVLGADGAAHHLFDPRTGRSSQHWRSVTVYHRSAAVADALSTALSAATAAEIAELVSARTVEGMRVLAVDRDGRETVWRSRPAYIELPLPVRTARGQPAVTQGRPGTADPAPPCPSPRGVA